MRLGDGIPIKLVPTAISKRWTAHHAKSVNAVLGSLGLLAYFRVIKDKKTLEIWNGGSS